MAKLIFGPWLPDLYNLNAEAANVAQNVLPGVNAYHPFPQFSALTGAALPAGSKGLFCAQRSDGSWLFFAGTATKLYRLTSILTGWTDVSRLVGGNYACAATDKWSFDQYGTRVIAVQQGDDPQYIDVDSGNNFAVLGGSPPRAGIVKTVGSFVMLGRLVGLPNRIQWSGFEDSAGWTVGVNGSDFQDFYDGGQVKAIVGGENALVFQQRAIRRVTYVPGASYTFGIEKVSEGRGAVSQFGVVRAGQAIYYLAEDGFCSIGGPRELLGEGTINKYFKARASQSGLSSVMALADPVNPRIYFAYRSVDNAQTYYDRMIVYDLALDRPTECLIAVTDLAQGASVGVTLENLDTLSSSIDALTTPLDSSVYTGGVRTLSAVSYSGNSLGFFQGANAEATLETGEHSLGVMGRKPVFGSRAFINRAQIDADTTSWAVSVAGRETQGGAIEYGAESAAGITGEAPLRSSARFHRFRVRIPTGTDWTHAQGVEVPASLDGQR